MILMTKIIMVFIKPMSINDSKKFYIQDKRGGRLLQAALLFYRKISFPTVNKNRKT